jgi:aryl-alcohol dehydrogenase-like predicted oxidoreductase
MKDHPMQKRPLGRSGLEIAPLVFGGNVFGWTVDEPTSFRLLDAFVDAGLNAIDTADVYSRWVPDNRGGESETIIGNWLRANPGKRGKVLILTKVGGDMGQGHKDLSAKWIEKEVENSLRRLNTDVIDLYQSHWPDPNTPHEETLRAYEALMKAGKVRAIGTSNYDAALLAESLKVAKEKGLPRYETLQPQYNLYDRADFDGPLRDLVMREGIGVITYFSLASGFLSGKYRSKEDLAESQRGSRVEKYLGARGMKILAALDEVAARNGATPAEVALAWVIAREGVTAPIASATSLEQLASLVKSVRLTLSAEDIAALDAASA